MATRLGLLRILLPFGAAALLALALGAVAIRGSFASSLPLTVSVIGVYDAYQVGTITSADVEVANHGNAALQPLFSVVWEPQPARWEVVEGPRSLAPGARAIYRIEAVGAITVPPAATPFRVRVNTPGSIVYAVSGTVHPERTKPGITNPGLRLWSEGNPVTGPAAPVGWQAYAHFDSGDEVTIGPTTVAGREATRFHVVQDGRPDPDAWSHTGLTQYVPFPRRSFTVSALSEAPYQVLDGGWPLTAFGIEIADGHNGLLWLLFQPTGKGDLDYNLPTGHHIHVFDVPAGRWTNVRVDLASIYGRLGWTPPSHVGLKLFIAAASARPNDISGYIGGIETAAAPN